MDKLQRQIMELNYKVNRLSQIVERISKHINVSNDEILETRESSSHFNSHLTDASSLDNIFSNFSDNPYHQRSEDNLPMIIGHKDIIDDEESSYQETHDYSKSPSEQDMSYELQVQRLTAQLTAAYHRIASLEEQLLAKRNQS